MKLTKLRQPLAIAMLVALIIKPGVALAFDWEDAYHDAKYTSQWYDPKDLECAAPADEGGGSAASGDLKGNDNILKAFNYFVSKGFTKEQAAGILGNLMQESRMDPKADNPAASGIGGGGGIAQWEGPRWGGDQGLLAFAKKAGKPWQDLGVQLDFIMYELDNTERQAKSMIKGAKTVKDAVIAWEEGYERAGIPVLGNRLKYGEDILKEYGPQVTGAPSSDSGSSGDATACATDAGANGNVNADGYSFPLEPQKKINYNNVPCSKSACHHDGTPAADLMYGSDAEVGGKKVYAITDGKIINADGYGGVAGCFAIQFLSTKDNKYYWYGHLQNPKVKAGATVKGGQQIAEAANQNLGSECRGGRTHLHIDRGCTRDGKPQQGGYADCRDPEFVPLMNKIHEKLPQ